MAESEQEIRPAQDVRSVGFIAFFFVSISKENCMDRCLKFEHLAKEAFTWFRA